MRPKRSVSYCIFAEDCSLSFRDNVGNLHRGFDVDPSSDGCVWRGRPKGALRVARRIAELTGKTMVIEMVKRRRRHGGGRKGWSWWRWTVKPEAYRLAGKAGQRS